MLFELIGMRLNLIVEQPWVFALSCVGLIPLAERVSFLTE